MNIEDLSKTQLLWLMIMVNFITSIATGVLTVSLLDQAPLTVPQTVNQIVERTIQTVATGTPLSNIVIPKPIPPATPAPTEEERLTKAFQADALRTVYLFKSSTTTQALGVGAYLPKSRAVATVSSKALPSEILIQFANGSTARASISKVGATLTIYGFSDTEILPSAPMPSLLSAASLKQGQTVVGLGRDGSAAIGIVSKVDDLGIHTNVTSVPVGGASVDRNGDLIGIAIDSLGTFASAEKINTLLISTTTPK